MLPLLPFALGLVTGAVAFRLLKNVPSGKVLDSARTRLRSATVSGLESVASASERMRDQLVRETGVPPEEKDVPAERVLEGQGSSPVPAAEAGRHPEQSS